MGQNSLMDAAALVQELKAFIERAVEHYGGSTEPLRPAHRVPFVWPGHPISLDYHVLASDWTGTSSFEAHGDSFKVSIARTPFGVFGRSVDHWNEARGETEEEMLERLKTGMEPLFQRQFAISRCLGREGRFVGNIRDLDPLSLIKLLYCPDRDVAHEAAVEIETKASQGFYGPALIHVIRDDRHPNRRIAQWCVLDMFEDLPAFCPTPELQREAIEAIKGLIWSAPDDHARTVYKAGVVLGGHVCTDLAADALIACISAESKIGRRSAMHAVFHLNEWMPGRKQEIVDALWRQAKKEENEELRYFASQMAEDIETDAREHVTEPIFPEELDPC